VVSTAKVVRIMALFSFRITALPGLLRPHDRTALLSEHEGLGSKAFAHEDDDDPQGRKKPQRIEELFCKVAIRDAAAFTPPRPYVLDWALAPRNQPWL
jgi:hypothetical protein